MRSRVAPVRSVGIVTLRARVAQWANEQTRAEPSLAETVTSTG